MIVAVAGMQQNPDFTQPEESRISVQIAGSGFFNKNKVSRGEENENENENENEEESENVVTSKKTKQNKKYVETKNYRQNTKTQRNSFRTNNQINQNFVQRRNPQTPKILTSVILSRDFHRNKASNQQKTQVNHLQQSSSSSSQRNFNLKPTYVSTHRVTSNRNSNSKSRNINQNARSQFSSQNRHVFVQNKKSNSNVNTHSVKTTTNNQQTQNVASSSRQYHQYQNQNQNSYSTQQTQIQRNHEYENYGTEYPETFFKSSFSCVDKVYGYYADQDNNCRIYHICNPYLFHDGRIETYHYR